MTDWPPDTSEAIVICTRNRPEDLRATLTSVADQSRASQRPVLIIDGSDETHAVRNAELPSLFSSLPLFYERYPGSPATTRQRNYGLDLLPASVDIVHFIDDDVTLKSGYFDALSRALRGNDDLGGVGAVEDSETSSPSVPQRLFRRLFLLSRSAPGRVLSSGRTTPAHQRSVRSPYRVEWLSNCAVTYRRNVFSDYRFDPQIEGVPPLLEDLDFSYRVVQKWPLAVAPSAQYIHRSSPKNRRHTEDMQRERVIRRYLFVKKNLSSFRHTLAYWWAMFGRLLATALSRDPDAPAAHRGVRRGLKAILRRDHPLLS